MGQSVSFDGATLVWFRRDLRLQDNPAFALALSLGRPMQCVYITDHSLQQHSGGLFEVVVGAAYWWLCQSLRELSADIESLGGSPLVLKKGCSLTLIKQMVSEQRISLCTWNRSLSPYQSQKDHQIEKALHRMGVKTRIFDSSWITDPQMIRTHSGQIYSQFTPYWKNVSQRSMIAPVKSTFGRMIPFSTSDHLSSWQELQYQPHWARGMQDLWHPGEKKAQKSLKSFVNSNRLHDYPHHRDYPWMRGTSRLSPHLAFGELSHRQVYHAIHCSDHPNKHEFLRQLAWREFSFYQLFHNPTITSEHAKLSSFSIAFREDSEVSCDLEKWRKGKTGYPLVDAGMRELYATGWMHNRVRMVVACFLSKNLLIHWIHGARWFHDTLLDACVANNIAGWRWIVSVMPYFRIFHPMLQSQKFDPQGRYIKLWVKELQDCPVDRIHDPFLLISHSIKKNIKKQLRYASTSALWHTYPPPMVDYKLSRQRALAAYKAAFKKN